MSDLISRQAAVDLIMETDPWWCEGMTRAIFEGIKALPSAQPEPSQCWGCNCPKMQKTFSEMVHLHDAEDGGGA